MGYETACMLNPCRASRALTGLDNSTGVHFCSLQSMSWSNGRNMLWE